MLLLYIITDAKNKNTDTGIGAKNQADGADGEHSLTEWQRQYPLNWELTWKPADASWKALKNILFI